jgi:hypothetical protein
VVRLIIIAIILTYFIGCFWFLFCSVHNEHNDYNTFIKEFGLQDQESMYQLIISAYYALTTLSTVGYGDYYPISSPERLVAVIVMLIGVAFFSYIMGNFIEILSNYDKNMGNVDQSGDLNNWLVLLTRFTRNNAPLAKKLTDDIESDFNFYWANDRLSCLVSNDYIQDLPRILKS